MQATGAGLLTGAIIVIFIVGLAGGWVNTAFADTDVSGGVNMDTELPEEPESIVDAFTFLSASAEFIFSALTFDSGGAPLIISAFMYLLLIIVGIGLVLIVRGGS